MRQGTLQVIWESIQPGQVWLFPGRSSGHLCTKTVLRTIDRLVEEAGIPRDRCKHRYEYLSTVFFCRVLEL